MGATDDRQSTALLLLPLFLLAVSIGVSQSFRPLQRAVPIAWPVADGALQTPELAALRAAIRAKPPRGDLAVPRVAAKTSTRPSEGLPDAQRPVSRLLRSRQRAELLAPVVAAAEQISALVTQSSVARRVVSSASGAVATVHRAETGAPSPLPPLLAPPPVPPTANAPIAAARVHARGVTDPAPLLPLAAMLPPSAEAGICTMARARGVVSHRPPFAAASSTPGTFGLQLAAAAVAQTGDLVIYNDQYRLLRFPMGDVPALFGVCTDVVVRAFRALGIDLQALVQLAGSGSGDRNIDHRRTEVLRRFFTAHGASLPVTDFAEDYRPGDIVTYHRPQNQHSRSHIAIVSDRLGPSGRPMIVHNRGWGTQLEDGLFVDQITGHYRFQGLRARRAPLITAGGAAARPLSAIARPRAFPAAHSHAAADAGQGPAPPGSPDAPAR